MSDRKTELAWTAMTVRIAWELHRAGVRVAPGVVRAARKHLLLSMERITAVDVDALEWRATAATMEFLGRVRHGRYARWSPPHTDLPRVDVSWRRSVEAACDPLSLVVLRLHYGDGLSREVIGRRAEVDPSALQASVEGLREVVRMEVRRREHREPPAGHGWVDALLQHVAVVSGARCPPVSEVGTWGRLEAEQQADYPDIRRHVESCPRCTRLVRLLRAGLLREELFAVPDPFPPPQERMELLALHLHPEVRRHRDALARALGDRARCAGEDSILLELTPETGEGSEDAPGGGLDWERIVTRRVRMGLPSRDHIRGAKVEGPGAKTTRTLLGPAPLAALEASRARPWGEIDGMEELPDPLPPPPSVARWWTTAALFALLAMVVMAAVLLREDRDLPYPIEARVHRGGGGITLRFDVDDRAWLNIYAWRGLELEPLLVSRNLADKGDLATGYGSYDLVTLDGGLVLVSAPEPLDDLDDIEKLWATGRMTPELFETRVRSLHPRADVLMVPARAP